MRVAYLLPLLLLAGCQAVMGAFGYVPVEAADGGEPARLMPSALGIEEAVGISGGASIVVGVLLNMWRNHTRAKAVAAAAEAGRYVSSQHVEGKGSN